MFILGDNIGYGNFADLLLKDVITLRLEYQSNDYGEYDKGTQRGEEGFNENHGVV